MRMISRLHRLGAAALLAVLYSGCGGSENVDTVPVTGVVTVDGKAIEGATVTFTLAEGSGKAASGTTDDEGKFSLQTYVADDGAAIGKHNVTISKVGGGNSVPSSDPDEMEKAPMESPIAEKYGNVETSELTETVTKDGKNHFEFKLSK
ncbi:MAG: carboxypeptidase-like regulatory domain-containing protein [Planctomycetota bacterium]|nr:carboxypeptidase-like regulatory domain-containing protein [Planctomycetota bacterium]